MTTKVTMPSLGESVVEGTIGKWLVAEGQRVEKDQPIVEILTDKADTEIPAPVAGVLTKHFAEVDAILEVGDTLCEIDENGTATATPAASAPTSTGSSAASSQEPITSPSVRKLARERGVDLDSISGSGESGRITQDDVIKATATAAPAPQATPAMAPPKQRRPAPAAAAGGRRSAFRLPPYVAKPGDEVIPFTRRRRIIADHMVFSKQTSPDVVTFAEVDLHKVTKIRNVHKGAYKKDGVSLSFLAFSVQATARALKEFPEVNARVLDDAYVKIKAINIGVAVDTPEGLVVPVIKNADSLSLRGISLAITDLAKKARDKDLTPDDLAGKTFTVSNPGRKGNLVGGAIISQPNVGILRLGTIKKRVVVVEHDDEDLMAIHPVMHMALSYDHRIVDGVHANGFLYRIGEILESGDFDL